MMIFTRLLADTAEQRQMVVKAVKCHILEDIPISYCTIIITTTSMTFMVTTSRERDKAR